jgi:hypothetical protein
MLFSRFLGYCERSIRHLFAKRARVGARRLAVCTVAYIMIHPRGGHDQRPTGRLPANTTGEGILKQYHRDCARRSGHRTRGAGPWNRGSNPCLPAKLVESLATPLARRAFWGQPPGTTDGARLRSGARRLFIAGHCVKRLRWKSQKQYSRRVWSPALNFNISTMWI